MFMFPVNRELVVKGHVGGERAWFPVYRELVVKELKTLFHDFPGLLKKSGIPGLFQVFHDPMNPECIIFGKISPIKFSEHSSSFK